MKNIVLIGPIAAGKTTVGQALAEQRGEIFIDTDQCIEKEMGQSIPLILETHGEKYFRELETQILERSIQLKNAVISTGGGVVLNPYNRELIKLHSYRVYLQVDLQVQLARLANTYERPILKGENKAKILEELRQVRIPHYEQIADLTIDTSTKTCEAIVHELHNITRQHIK